MRKLLYLPLILVPAVLGGLRGAAPPAPAASSAHELVVLHPKRPYRIRIHMQLKGKPHDMDWNRLVESLFRYLDTNGDGTLSKAEASRAPSREQWQQMSIGVPEIDPDPAPDFQALTRGKDRATVDDLKSWYRASTAGPFQVGWGWRGRPGEVVSDALWRHLDTARDGRLSRAELEAAPRVLERLDIDEDEMLGQNEIMGISRGQYYEPPPTFTRGVAHGLARGGLPFFSRRLDEPTEPLVRVLREWYGRAAKSPELGDLTRWASQPPDVEVRVSLEADAKEGIQVLAARAADVGARRDVERVRLVLGGWWLELNRAVMPSRRPGEPARNVSGRELFRQLDMDGNGYLDRGEIFRPPFRHVALLRLADRDDDGKITEKEFVAFSELKSTMQARMTFLRVEDRGRSLFRILDRDGDGRLGIRERRNVWKHLGGLIRDPRGLDRGDLPQEYRVLVAHGQVPAYFDNGPDVQPRPRAVPPRGPVWFRKMDRNTDGDISRAEWLGTALQFQKIDTDGDGLIGVEEAWRADAWFRKPAR